MSDPFDAAIAKAEAEQAEQRRQAELRRIETEAREKAKRTALRERLGSLVKAVSTKEEALKQRGFTFRERVDEQRPSYGLLLSAGRRRISISLTWNGAYSISVYTEGVREPDGFQTIINSQSPSDEDALMAILGDWIVRYGPQD